MKLFAAIVDAEIVRMFYEKTGIKLNYLISYYYLKNNAYKLIHEYRDMMESLYLDSGAFSVASGRSEISVSEYLKYLKLYGSHFDEYFNLDDRFEDPEHNQWNQDYLEDNLPSTLKKPIPVVHDYDSMSEFKLYVAMGHNFIAIGSSPTITVEDLGNIQSEFPDVRIHMFGNIEREMLIKCKPYSADSATWAHDAKHGDIAFWDPDEEKGHKIFVGSRDKKENPIVHFNKFEHKEKLRAFLYDTFGFDYKDLLFPKKGSLNRYTINLYFLKQLEDYLNRI